MTPNSRMRPAANEAHPKSQATAGYVERIEVHGNLVPGAGSPGVHA